MKTALVTGAGIRIGRAIAEELLLEGFYVILHANSSDVVLKSWVSQNEKKTHVIGLITADLATVDGQNSLVAQVKKHVEVLDLLVHNASTFVPKNFKDIERKDLSEMLAVNLEAPFFISQGLLSLLEKSSSPSIINILDAMWERPSPHFSHYAVSKAGLSILTRALANELAPKIRVNGVAPGAILFQPFHNEKTRAQTLEHIPAKRLGNPKDIAQAVVYLYLKARYANGEILVIDGGRSIAS